LATARAVAERYGFVSDGWNGFNLLHRVASRVGGLDLGLVPGAGGCDVAGMVKAAAAGEMGLLWLLGADEIDMDSLGDAFVVYQGHHGDAGAHRADVILPGAAYTEKSATFVNTEGRVQRTAAAHFPLGEAREDWTIIRAFSAVIGKTLPYNNVGELWAQMAKTNGVFAGLDVLEAAPWGSFGAAGEMTDAPFVNPIANFYMTDPISRASETMAHCTETLLNAGEATGTDG
jgi:NADH-quinone oxidoreductase subunit G